MNIQIASSARPNISSSLLDVFNQSIESVSKNNFAFQENRINVGREVKGMTNNLLFSIFNRDNVPQDVFHLSEFRS